MTEIHSLDDHQIDPERRPDDTPVTFPQRLEIGHSGDEEDQVYTPAPAFNPVVEALKASNLYREALGDGQHSLTCPWAAEHGHASQSQAVYTEPDLRNPFGQLRCAHVHAERRNTTNLIEHLGLTVAKARTKPRIRVSPGDSHLAAVAAERVLAADGAFFHAGGPIVRVIEHNHQGLASELVNEQTLASTLAAKIDWEKKGRANEWTRCDPPQQVVQILLHGRDRLHLPALMGLARQPFFRPDGTLVRSSGFDAKSGIYAAFNDADYKAGEPTRELALHSLAYLKSFLDEFEFGSEADRAAALSAMLTAAIRPSLPQAPAFSISATRSGSGKSYLASIIARMAGPDEPFNVSYPTRADEATKVVMAMLLEKPSVILFDDMQTDWRSFGPLNKALTSPTTTERLLGSSRTATAATNVLFLGTGNNIEPVGDMRRRVVTVRLAPRDENPALRSFDGNPLEAITKHRARAVEAALTIIGAYKTQDSPQAALRPIGTYSEWSDLCRHSLVWLGEDDPATSLIEQVTNDSEQELLAELMAAWHRQFGSTGMTVRKVLTAVEYNSDLMDAFAELPVMEGRHISPGRLGWFLKKNCGRRAGGYQIERAESSERRAWRVVACQ